jgi:[CysO sulfur-carrier protein]-S-L-cysteine hydrolase
MEWTDRHCRFFHRLLTRRALIYTEMVTTGAVLRGDRARLIGFDPFEHPVALQLGGSEPRVADQTPGGRNEWHSWKRLLANQRQAGRDLLAEVYQHASEAYPNECCGFIRASGRVHRAVNDQDALHVEDPVRWPRSAREAYTLAAADLYILGTSFIGDDPAVVVYHSHPDVGAYFSEKDAADALFEGRPIYDVDHLVIDVRGARPKGAKLFRFLETGFVCVWSEER